MGRGSRRGWPASGGQALIEYLLMMLMLLFVFTGLYRVLTGQVRNKMFLPAGKAILRTYWKAGY